MQSSTNPIHTVLIGGRWHVEDDTTGVIYGPFMSVWAAISKMQELRGGKTAEATKQAVRRERVKEQW